MLGPAEIQRHSPLWALGTPTEPGGPAAQNQPERERGVTSHGKPIPCLGNWRSDYVLRPPTFLCYQAQARLGFGGMR